jgi:Protein of unknown function (DUF2927)
MRLGKGLSGTHLACKTGTKTRAKAISDHMSAGKLKENIFLSLSHITRHMRSTTAIVLALSALAFAIAPVHAENPDIASRRAAERHDFTNDEIKDGFFKIAFQAELQIGAKSDRVRKFDEPVRIFIDSKAQPDRSAEIATIVADIRRRIDHLDVAITDDKDTANFVVSLVSDHDVAATIRTRYGASRANQIEKALAPQCLSGIGKDKQFRIRRAEVILPVDAGDFTFYDCAYEELLQGLGAINDDASVPWTMFNDDVQMGFFDVYDQYLLNILYDPRIRPGMTKAEVQGQMPGVLPAARTFVANTNRPNRADAHVTATDQRAAAQEGHGASAN